MGIPYNSKRPHGANRQRDLRFSSQSFDTPKKQVNLLSNLFFVCPRTSLELAIAMKSIISAIVVYGVTLLAQATNFQVNVGVGGVVFTPNTVKAMPGDTVEFIVAGVQILLSVLCGMEFNFGGNRLTVSPKLLLMRRVSL